MKTGLHWIRHLSRMAISTCILEIIFSTPAVAELSPAVYRGMARASPEMLQIRVNSTAEYKLTSGVRIKVSSTIISVSRTNSHLEAGDDIEICYERDTKSLLGPSQPPILEKTAHYPAFLRKAEGCYRPAAGGHSFSAWLFEDVVMS